jgi:carboxymethylenebutenolidase
MGTTIELTAADGHRFAAYRAEPAGKPRGALVVIQEIFGAKLARTRTLEFLRRYVG